MSKMLAQALIMAYAASSTVSGKSDPSMLFDDLPSGRSKQTNKYEPNKCVNSRAKARRLRQMNRINLEVRGHD